MEDPKLLNSLLKTFKHGITPSNFPLAATLVYTAITKIAETSDEIAERCEFVLLYTIDNTNSGHNDTQIDAALKQMVPGIIKSLMNPTQTVGVFKRCFGCSTSRKPQGPQKTRKIKKPEHPRVEAIKFDAI